MARIDEKLPIRKQPVSVCRIEPHNNEWALWGTFRFPLIVVSTRAKAQATLDFCGAFDLDVSEFVSKTFSVGFWR